MATILIVDDDTALRSAIAMALADLGYQPKEARRWRRRTYLVISPSGGCGAARSADAGNGRDGGAAAYPSQT